MKISKMSGKLKGLYAINTNPLTNDFCNKMSENKNNVCYYCYSRRMLKTYRSSCIGPFNQNSVILSMELLDPKTIPFLNIAFLRVNAHGELINKIHLENILNIAKFNKHTKFSLTTKRIELLDDFEIPRNVTVIYGIPELNSLETEIPEKADILYRVFTEEFARDNNIEINCPKRCASCLKCYIKPKKKIIINELIK